MKVAFRVDASTKIGAGHAVRCRNLAAELQRRGADVQFIYRGDSALLSAILGHEKFHMTQLPGAHALEADDASQTLQVLNAGADMVVVDHYQLNAGWERRVRDGVKRVVAIEDTPNRAHEIDVLIDQNFSLSSGDRYDGLAPTGCQMLLGPRYAILGAEYQRESTVSPPRSATIGRLLISFGGSDPDDMTGAALASLSGPEFKALEIDVVVGSAYPFRSKLADAVARRPHTTLHIQLPSLAPLLQSADLAIGAGGISTWERFAFGIPTILISIANNQLPASADLDVAGLAVHLGARDSVTPGAIQAAVRDLMNDFERRTLMALRSQLTVDGFGSQRIAESLYPTPPEALRLRPATMTHVGYLFELANMPDVRGQSFSHSPSTWPEHVAWFTRAQMDIATQVWIMEAGVLPVGQIRADRRGQGTILNFALDPIVRGRGWGHRLLELGLASIHVGGIIAEVQPGNGPARAILARLGFACLPSGQTDKVVYARN